MGNGGVFASLRIDNDAATTSISPVSSFGLIASFERSSTRPLRAMTNSGRTRVASAVLRIYSSATVTAELTIGCVRSENQVSSTMLNVPKGKDVSDWVAAGGTADDLIDLVQRAEPRTLQTKAKANGRKGETEPPIRKYHKV